MPVFERDSISLHYEEFGQGPAILLFAPGGMRSAMSFWDGRSPDPRKALSPHFRVIAMDQRNAGSSRAPITGDDGWHSYSADHLALLDHLGIERAHLLGMCIGGAFCLELATTAPERVASAVMYQPIGLSPTNRPLFHELFDTWAQPRRKHHPGVDEAGWQAFRARMYDGDFVFSVDRDAVRGCRVPLLVLMGDDDYHPEPTSREIVELAPDAELIERWKTPPDDDASMQRVTAFLHAHS